METNLNTSHIPFGYKFTYSVKSFNKNPVLASNNLGYCSSLSFIFSREKHHLNQRQNKQLLLWNSQNREHQKYLWNVIVLPEISQ